MADDPWADDPNDRYGGDAPDAADGPHADLGTYASDRDVDAPNPKKGMGTGVKVLLGLLLGGGALCLLCCCGGYWEVSSQVNMDDTPAGVRARTDEILTLDVPADFTPQAAMDMNIPFVRWFMEMRMTLAAYGAPGGGQMLLMKLALPPEAAQDPAALEAQMKQSFNQNNNSGVRVDVTDSETRTLTTADGRAVDWTFGSGTGRNQQGADLGAFREVKGTIADGSNVYILQVALPEEEFDEAEIVAMLESIELVDPQTEPVPPGNEVPMNEAEVDVTPAGDATNADGDATNADGDAPIDAAAEAP